MLTCSDVFIPKDEFLCHSATHTHVHLSQQLSTGLTPPIIFWEHRHLSEKRQHKFSTLLIVFFLYIYFSTDNNKNGYYSIIIIIHDNYMTKGGSSRHDGSFIYGHGIFSIICHNGMPGFMICSDCFVFFVNLHTPALWA